MSRSTCAKTGHAFDNPVRVRRIKPDAGPVPRDGRHRVLGLISVALPDFASENGLVGEPFQMADSCERILHLLRLDAQLCLVRDLPVAAPAALVRDRTVALNAVRRRVQNFDDLADSVIFFRFDDVAQNAVALRRVGDEDGEAVIVADAASLGGHPVDGQFKLLVLFQHRLSLWNSTTTRSSGKIFGTVIIAGKADGRQWASGSTPTCGGGSLRFRPR